MKKLIQYISSPSTLTAITVGSVMYCSYAYIHSAWENVVLILVCLFVAIFLPAYSRLSNKVEEITNLRTAIVSIGRISRFVIQFIFNIGLFYCLSSGGVLSADSLEGLGGFVGISILTTAISQGVQYVAVMVFNRGYGDLNRNVIFALALNVIITAAATAGMPMIKSLFWVLSGCVGLVFFGIGILSDLRGVFFPRRGIGVFFGTFNPFHITHLEIVKKIISERNLSRVYIHSTVVPKLHAQALERGEINIDRVDGGLSFFEKTDRADLNVNYFPTGKRFYAPLTRKIMIEAAILEAGLNTRVEVMWYPDIYASDGFYGILSEIKKLHPFTPLHGIHGSDLGGMWIRGIYDEFGWIYPYAVRRQDNVSATAIRNGVEGLTSLSVKTILEGLRSNSKCIVIGARKFSNINGNLLEVEHNG